MVNHRWVPPLRQTWEIVNEVMVENALGIWWAEVFPLHPVHIGMVVPEMKDLENTITVD